MAKKDVPDLPVLEFLALSVAATASFTLVFFIGLILPSRMRGLERISVVAISFLAGLWAMPIACLGFLTRNLYRRLPRRAVVDASLLVFNILLSSLVTASIVA